MSNSPIPPNPAPGFFCMWAGCSHLTSSKDALWCDYHARKVQEGMRAGSRTSFSIPPEQRKTSYGLAVSLLGMAASSAAGVSNPLHRSLAIVVIAAVIYIIGLRTQ